MKCLRISGTLVILIFMTIVGCDKKRLNSFRIRARPVRVGDSKQMVQSKVGKPTVVFLPEPHPETNFLVWVLSVKRETWAYGSKFDFRNPIHSEFPYFYPFRARLFSPDSGDVAIEFGESGEVTTITIPGGTSSK
jgi:hypothetical protein